MSKITKEMFEKAYEVYQTEEQDINILIQMGMNENSARMTLKWYSKILSGELVKRTASEIQIKFILETLYANQEFNKLKLVLKALDKYIEFYQDKKLKNVKQFIKGYKSKLIYTEDIIYPDDIEDKDLLEGAKKQVVVNAYERNSQAREECINYYGCKCQICNFDFEKVYGEIGKDFVHVHHIVDISTIGENYQVNPIKDLIPVCPNCHAMLHKKRPAYKIKEIRNFINKKPILYE